MNYTNETICRDSFCVRSVCKNDLFTQFINYLLVLWDGREKKSILIRQSVSLNF